MRRVHASLLRVHTYSKHDCEHMKQNSKFSFKQKKSIMIYKMCVSSINEIIITVLTVKNEKMVKNEENIA